MLEEVTRYTAIEYVDLYGGEITALPADYVNELVTTVRQYYQGPINVVTNLLRPLQIDDPNIIVTVSYDFQFRERHETVLRNMKQSIVDLHVLTLATPGVIAGDVDEMIAILNDVAPVKTVEVKPYSTNQANQHNVPHVAYEDFVRRWIVSPVSKRFQFINEQDITRTLSGTRSSFSDDHVYITPSGRFAVLEFDLNDNEYFKHLDSFEDYVQWQLKEKETTLANTYCNQCQYLGRCLTEHIRVVKDVTNSCNGYYQLIEWYKNERMADKPTSV